MAWLNHSVAGEAAEEHSACQSKILHLYASQIAFYEGKFL